MNIRIRLITEFENTSNEEHNDRAKAINKQNEEIRKKLSSHLEPLICDVHKNDCFCNVLASAGFLPLLEGECCPEFSRKVKEEYLLFLPTILK